MKTSLSIICFLFIVLLSISCAAPISDPDNPHNLSSSSNNAVRSADPTAGTGGTDEICVFCHTPHGAAPQTPLWNRPDPADMGSFDVYAQNLVIKTRPDLTGYNSALLDYPNGASRMCLSCHDGATSVGVLLDREIAMEGGPVTLAPVNLATSHPVSFTYDTNVLALLNPADYALPDGTVDVPLDGSDRMQCTTCHDPHEDTGDLGTYGNLPFWRHQGDAASYDEVCNSCHKTSTGSTPPVHDLP